MNLRTLVNVSILGCLVLVSACTPKKPPEVVAAEAQLPDRVDFNLHIKPILSDRCFKCHGPDHNARKADFRLDTESGAFAELTKSRRAHAFVPGKLRKSEAFFRLTSEDPDYRMPPPESNLSLSAKEVATILRWIEQGAEYKPHWSLIRPTRAPPPGGDDVAVGMVTEAGIDDYIRARLSEAGLQETAEAERETLIRRVTFDLTGLPPTLEEIDAFLEDLRPDAYERVVDRLLASDAYGERMAAEWLDVARYADSHGYQDDGMRNMWPWRDWVIKAFNENMPYDAFVTWQLAGDLLPNATLEQRLATGFNRNHLQSQEGGIVPEEFRVDYVADRTNTFGKAFLGLTAECARCHDHKFDPVTQKEYFQLFSFFNSVNEFGNIPYAGEASPTVVLVGVESEAELARLGSAMRAMEVELDPDHRAFDDGYQSWLEQIDSGTTPIRVEPSGLIGHYPLEGFREGNDLLNLADLVQASKPGYFWGDKDKLPDVVDGEFGQALRLRGDGWLDMGKDRYDFERNDPFSISIWFNVEKAGTAGPLFTRSGGLFNGLRGYGCVLAADGTLSASLNHVFPDNAIEVETLDPVSVGSWQHLVMTYDGSSRAAGIALYVDGVPLALRVKVDHLKQSIRHIIDPDTGKPTNWGDPGNLRIGFVGANLPTLEGVLVDEFKVFDRRLTGLEVGSLYGDDNEMERIANTAREARSASQHAALRDYYVTTVAPTYGKRMQTLTKLRGEENEIMSAQPEVMVLRDLPEPRPTHVLYRGAYDAPRERVDPGTPASILPFDDSLPKNRLGLAQWLVDPRNPLTARVAVNRYWQLFFGRGLVATPDDFGKQGALPTHPRLLDWLATEFVESGWDVKGLQKKIVMSATYRQSSRVGPELLERDPGNILLARGPSNRLPAEMMRDNALAVSGLLVQKIGGPSVKPYQPEGLWKELATRNATEYVQDHGDKLYRRSLYTIWKRTTPPPSMISFDATERNVCTVRRQSTSTPLQALILLNDPQYVEASRVLSERLTRETVADPADRIVRAFRLLTGRRPTAEELSLLQQLYEEERARFRASPGAARQLLAVGEYPRDPRVAVPETAALTLVTNTIMNFDEAVIKR